MTEQDTRAKFTRRRHNAGFKSELIERSLQRGASVSAIALENGINANLLFKWRRMHLRATAQLDDRRDACAVLLPVKLSAGDAQTAPAPKSAMLSTRAVAVGVIEIDIGAARVRLRGSVDEANVRCVLHVLSALA